LLLLREGAFDVGASLLREGAFDVGASIDDT
jgi:hypothetical protein